MGDTAQPIAVWVELTEPEVVDACKQSCGVPGLIKAGAKSALVPFIILLVYWVWRADDIALHDGGALGLLALLFVATAAAFALGVFKRIGYIEYRFVAHRFYQDPLIYAIGQEGLTVSSYQGDDRLPWSHIQQVVEMPEMLVITTVKGTVLPVPKRCFENDSDLAQATSHLRAFAPLFAVSAGQKSPMRVSPRR